MQDWCENPGTHVCPHDKPRCPDWQQKSTAGGDPDLTHGKGVKINRKTWAWNAAAGSFAYAFGTLAEHGCKTQHFVSPSCLKHRWLADQTCSSATTNSWRALGPTTSPQWRCWTGSLAIPMPSVGAATALFLPFFSSPFADRSSLLADFVTQLLASTIGAAAEKALFTYTATAGE